MNATDARNLLVSIAKRDEGKREVTLNRAPWIAKLWPATSYPEGHANREPYCAAGMCYVLATFIAELRAQGQLVATLGMTGAKAEKWRCKSARAYGWLDWAESKGVLMLPDTAKALPGDFCVFDFSHIGMVVADKGGSLITTCEFNTNSGGSRDGDGCWVKTRRRIDVQKFIRILPETT